MPTDESSFSCLDDHAIRQFEKVAVKKRYPKNTILFSKGDASDSLCIVSSGKVKAIINDEDGKEIVLSIIGQGEFFGEMGAFDGVPRSATIVTKEPSELLIIHRDDFRNILSSSPDIVLNLVKVLLDRLRKANQKIESLALMNVHGRVINLLMQFAEPEGQKWVVQERITHQEIANMVGSSREMVSKIMKDLENEGYISMDQKRITINRRLA